MICRECREWLLTAPSAAIVEALEGPSTTLPDGAEAGDEACATHVGACPECGAAGRRIALANVELASALDALVPRRSLREAAAEAAMEAERRATRRRKALAATGAAVAVSVAGLLALPGPDVGSRAGREGSVGRERPVTLARAKSGALLPAVEASEEESVMVLGSADDDVVVFWFYQGRSE